MTSLDVEERIDYEITRLIAYAKSHLYLFMLYQYVVLSIALLPGKIDPFVEDNLWMKCRSILVCIELYLIGITIVALLMIPPTDYCERLGSIKLNIVVATALVKGQYLRGDAEIFDRLMVALAAISFTMTLKRNPTELLKALLYALFFLNLATPDDA